MGKKTPDFISTTNACKLCRPLGAVLAFRGVAGAVPYLHGSQGCATYMRRYIISHFNEPIDIASSSLGEKNAIYGGGPNLMLGLQNVTAKYRPALIGIATTCLTETIGDDLNLLLAQYRREFIGDDDSAPLLIRVSTPSYAGSHMEGFHGAVMALVEQLAAPAESDSVSGQAMPTEAGINLFPGLVSPADLRLLKDILAEFNLPATILPDFSDTLDGPALEDYPLIPPGGTEIAAIAGMGRAAVSIEFGRTIPDNLSAAGWLAAQRGVSRKQLGLPLGLRETDRLMELLAQLAASRSAPTGCEESPTSAQPALPPRQAAARGRLLDAMVDGHKYLAGKRALVYGEEDLVVGLSSLLAELGIRPVLCASGGKSGKLAAAIGEVTGELLPAGSSPEVYEDCDFFDIAERARQLKPDLIIGHSKGYSLARELAIPLIRLGFPIHDRLGGQRILHLGYQGAQQLFDTIVNTLIAHKQDSSPVGYSYM
ncbi:nitrogenase component 1 [Desulfurivibrio alkaliphilus]|uniref:Nitrogenase n=1 Tax=Desulfurivibrio alkaliphilus (strain DSM 19089 / UNIQEM U267 / AHT2) TaxID=589865 RepID=D6Z0A7_DESAT|nr:nitrogenase component 1 [Desulfurivibrio alkaliphilus]ADH87140.1 Nitrogenase [Desulfurivibrio alkaliphilus AHT 2]